MINHKNDFCLFVISNYVHSGESNKKSKDVVSAFEYAEDSSISQNPFQTSIL